jgi:hypothetical protein
MCPVEVIFTVHCKLSVRPDDSEKLSEVVIFVGCTHVEVPEVAEIVRYNFFGTSGWSEGPVVGKVPGWQPPPQDHTALPPPLRNSVQQPSPTHMAQHPPQTLLSQPPPKHVPENFEPQFLSAQTPPFFHPQNLRSFDRTITGFNTPVSRCVKMIMSPNPSEWPFPRGEEAILRTLYYRVMGQRRLGAFILSSPHSKHPRSCRRL